MPIQPNKKADPKWSLQYGGFTATAASEDLVTYPLCKDWEIGVITNAIIWRLMDIDMQGIYEDTAAEVYARIHVTERIEKTSVRDAQGDPQFITPLDIRNHIGLWTNVVPKPRPTWMRVVNAQVDAARRLYLEQFAPVPA